MVSSANTAKPESSSRSKQKREKSRLKEERERKLYDLKCVCGEKCAGDREDQAQLISCPMCGLEWFILPVDPYPPPSDTRDKKRQEKERKKRRKAFFKKLRNFPQTLVQGSVAIAKNSYQGTKYGIVESVKAIIRFFTPLRLIFTVILMAVGVSGYFGVQSYLYEAARKNLRDAVVKAEAALKKEDLTTAAEEYNRASAAIKTLGKDEPYLRDVDCYARETFALTHLSDDNLLDFAELATKTISKEGSTSWNNYFRSLNHDKFLVLDLTIKEEQLQALDSEKTLFVPLWLARQVVFIELPYEFLSRLDTSAGSVRVIVSGQLEGFESYPYEDANIAYSWKLSFVPESLYLWAHEDTLKYLGIVDGPWTKGETVQEVLKRQRLMHNLTENPLDENESANGETDESE